MPTYEKDIAAMAEAIKKQNASQILLLVEKVPALLNMKFPPYGATPLSTVVVCGNQDAVRKLLGFGANPNIVDNNHNLPLAWAILKGFPEIAMLLVSSGSRMDVKDKTGCSPISLAKKISVSQSKRAAWQDLIALMENQEARNEDQYRALSLVEGYLDKHDFLSLRATSFNGRCACDSTLDIHALQEYIQKGGIYCHASNKESRFINKDNFSGKSYMLAVRILLEESRPSLRPDSESKSMVFLSSNRHIVFITQSIDDGKRSATILLNSAASGLELHEILNQAQRTKVFAGCTEISVIKASIREDCGYIYPEFPLMGTAVLPESILNFDIFAYINFCVTWSAQIITQIKPSTPILTGLLFLGRSSPLDTLLRYLQQPLLQTTETMKKQLELCAKTYPQAGFAQAVKQFDRIMSTSGPALQQEHDSGDAAPSATGEGQYEKVRL